MVSAEALHVCQTLPQFLILVYKIARFAPEA